jgi:hypothetical protein
LHGQSAFAFPSISRGVGGALTLAFKGLAAGGVRVKAIYRRTRTLVRRVHGHNRRVHKTETLTYASGTAAVGATGSLKITLKPIAPALKFLRAQKRLKVLLTITYTQSGLVPSTQTKTITVVYHSHKPKHH